MTTRADILRELGRQAEPWDVLVIGGGASGLGAAVEAASRGSRTLLVERSDFAKGPSSRSLMIGGEGDAVLHLDPIFKTLAPGRGDIPRTPGREKVRGTVEEGYLHCGPSGAGHFVKIVHNGIEYGLMAAYSEGLNILRHANVGKNSRTADAETTPLRNSEFYEY